MTADTTFRRIPDAEATAFPWWCIIDPARIMLPHPEDVGALHRCPECGAEEGKACVEAADDDPDCGTRVCDEPHSSRTDYRSEVTAGHMYGAITGPFFSRTAAQKHVDARRHAYSDRAQVWCLSGHESPDWRAFCMEAPKAATQVTLPTASEVASLDSEPDLTIGKRFYSASKYGATVEIEIQRVPQGPSGWIDYTWTDANGETLESTAPWRHMVAWYRESLAVDVRARAGL